ncbi:MAG: peptidase M36, partial [Betaproteobacteria bacterium]
MKTIDALIRAAAAVVLLLTVSFAAFAQGAVADFELRRASVVRPDAGHALTAPSQAAHASIVGNYLRSRGASTATVGSLRQVDAGKSRKDIVHLRMEQQVAGLTVYGSYVKAAINARGELVHLIERIAPVRSAALVGAAIGEQQALAAAMARVHSGEAVKFREIGRSGNVARFAGGRFFHSDPTVEKVAVPRKDGSMAVGYLVETWSEKDNLLHHTLVGGDGRVLAVERRTANDTYRVFTEDPLKGAQIDVAGPGAGNTESPSGWLGTGAQTTINISGNNANAYLDANNDNRADSGGTAVIGGLFQTNADLDVTPSTTGNRAVSVQNLF